ncbi:hypothetical protein JRI60_38515 [Archangium violaceum]|uniref:hypothetical protein n=1 Tax=Archangium violaceum TaxID=83451 RepID=UPI001951F38F|nr:hypothetical protein [Archangium violaceum]QRO02847.1 hypothetical protein JRI60_38515 [Archangium violaceum]
MGGNAFLLSVLYLMVGIVVEGARRLWPGSPFLLQFSLSLDSLPARALELVGLMQPLRDAYFNGQISEFRLRLVFGVTTIVIIFLLAVVVGLFMGTLRGLVVRQASRR